MSNIYIYKLLDLLNNSKKDLSYLVFIVGTIIDTSHMHPFLTKMDSYSPTHIEILSLNYIILPHYIKNIEN